MYPLRCVRLACRSRPTLRAQGFCQSQCCPALRSQDLCQSRCCPALRSQDLCQSRCCPMLRARGLCQSRCRPTLQSRGFCHTRRCPTLRPWSLCHLPNLLIFSVLRRFHPRIDPNTGWPNPHAASEGKFLGTAVMTRCPWMTSAVTKSPQLPHLDSESAAKKVPEELKRFWEETDVTNS